MSGVFANDEGSRSRMRFARRVVKKATRKQTVRTFQLALLLFVVNSPAEVLNPGMRSPTAKALERPVSCKKGTEDVKYIADLTACMEEVVRENGGSGGGGGERYRCSGSRRWW